MATKNTRKRSENTEQPVSHEETRRRRKKRARRLMLKRLLIITLIFVTVWVVWTNWDTLAPDKLLEQAQDFINDSAGTYPVDISGTEIKGIARAQNYNVVLSDSYLTYYNNKGGEVNRYPCTYSSALLRTAGKYVLTAEQSGKRLQLSTRSMLLAEITTEQDILTVSVNPKGQFAVLTQGTQGYAVELTVYDQKGQILYNRKRNNLAAEVALSPNGKTVALLSIDTDGGVLNSQVDVFSLSSTDTQAAYSYKAEDTLLYRAEFLSNDRLAAVGENGALLFTISRSDATPYTTGGERLLGYAVADGSVALVTRPLGETGDGAVSVVDGQGNELCRVSFEGEFRCLTAEGAQYLLLTDKTAQVIRKSGAGKSAAVAADGQQALLCGNDAVVLGLSALQQYPLT